VLDNYLVYVGYVVYSYGVWGLRCIINYI